MTASEFLEKEQFNPDKDISFEEYHGDQTTYICQDAMLAFAKFHVEQALKSASEKTTVLVNGYETNRDKHVVKAETNYYDTEIKVSKNSILNITI